MTDKQRESYDNFQADCKIALSYMTKKENTVEENIKEEKIEAVKNCKEKEQQNENRYIK